MTPREEIKAAYKKVCEAEDAYTALVERYADDQDATEMHGAVAEMRKASRQPFPTEITGIDAKGFGEPMLSLRPPGTFVSVRPCAKEHEGKTFFGILLGDLPIGIRYRISEAGVLTVGPSGNPGIWVPALGKIIYGCGSWWGPIKSADDVEQITDDDIQNVWYMKALRAQFAEAAGEETSS